MLIGIEKLRELFESSGNGLRFNWADDYLKLQEYLATNKIKIEQINLTATHNGVFAKLLDFLANHRAWDEISVAQVLPELGSIVNYDGQRHGALCLSAAAWLIDHGYEVLTEVWLNGRRVDLMTKCHTWLIECGETSPQPLVSHLNRGINKIAIIPFQGQELSSIEAVIFTKSNNWSSDFAHKEGIVDLASEVQRFSSGVKEQTGEQNVEIPRPSELTFGSIDIIPNLFIDYANQKSLNTVLAQHADLELLSRFLQEHSGQHFHSADELQADPFTWANITSEVVEGFVKWQLQEGHAIASINRRLSIIKNYAKLATKAGVMSVEQLALIKTVTGYGKTEAKRIDIKRNVTRVGEKKATAVRLSVEQANQLKQQPDTPQGRRDALLMCLLLDHGLRVGEVALLQAEQFDRASGQFRFERPKVDGTQTHKLTADTLRAFYAWVSAGDCPSTGPLLRESLKNGELTEPGMSERAIKARVRLLGERIGVSGLSPHDCRHFWATYWADKVNILRLQEAGGWASLEMPRRYVERAKIANEGMA